MAKEKKPVNVRAIKRGYYDQLREPGDVFVIRSEDDMGSWMKKTGGRPKAEADVETMGPGDEQTPSDEVI